MYLPQTALTLLCLVASISLVLIAPGYLLSLWLFLPARLDKLERAFVTLSSSVVISSLLASAIMLISGQLNDIIFVTGILLVCFVAACGSLIRLRGSKEKTQTGYTQAKDEESTSRSAVKHTLGALSFTILAGLVVVLLFTPTPILKDDFSVPAELTEFYISPAEVEGVLGSLAAGSENPEISLGITNHNERSIEYHIQVLNGEQLINILSGIVIEGGDTWMGMVTIPGQAQSGPINIYLYTDTSASPIAFLRLWPELERSAYE